MAGLCVYTVLYGLTQWLQAGRGMSSEKAGLLLLPMSALSALLVRPISQRNLVRMPLVVAAVSCLAASAGVCALNTSTPIAWIVVITLLFGVTLGTTISANQTALYTQVTADQIGTAAGLFRTFGFLGSIASSALISVVFHTQVNDHRLHVIALIMVLVSVLGLIIVVTDRKIMTRVPVRPDDPAPVRRDDPPAGHRRRPDREGDTPTGSDRDTDPRRAGAGTQISGSRQRPGGGRSL
ncbi:MFS transporter [Streptomyces sp. MCA2]|uniref:MFS transporter n=1 Tax=Streptomyces sp. MCA2 TaxID=2944805 RepID=UPI0035ABA282